MDLLLLVGRILFGALFLGSAAGHLTQTAETAAYARSRGVPVPRIATLLSGVQIAAGGVLVVLGVWGDLGALLLLAFLAPTAVVVHGFWSETDATERQVEMIQFMKDVALAGGALALWWAFAQDPGLTLSGPLLS